MNQSLIYAEMECPEKIKGYTLLRKLGQGGYGAVGLYQDRQKTSEYAIKIVLNKDNSGQSLINESIILRKLNDLQKNQQPLSNEKIEIRVPKYVDHGLIQMEEEKQTCNYLTMEYLDKDLEEHFDSNIHQRGTITKKLIQSLQSIHQSGYLHRDIKPANFRVKNDQIYMIDFGLAKEYLRNGTHIEENIIGGLLGTPITASIFAHDYREISRRDDLISLMYSILLMSSKQKLPWYNDFLESTKQQKNQQLYFRSIKEKKDKLNPQQFEGNIYDQAVVRVIKGYLEKLRFDEEPNYDAICKYLLHDNAEEMAQKYDDIFWQEKEENLNTQANMTLVNLVVNIQVIQEKNQLTRDIVNMKNLEVQKNANDLSYNALDSSINIFQQKSEKILIKTMLDEFKKADELMLQYGTIYENRNFSHLTSLQRDSDSNRIYEAMILLKKCLAHQDELVKTKNIEILKLKTSLMERKEQNEDAHMDRLAKCFETLYMEKSLECNESESLRKIYEKLTRNYREHHDKYDNIQKNKQNKIQYMSSSYNTHEMTYEYVPHNFKFKMRLFTEYEASQSLYNFFYQIESVVAVVCQNPKILIKQQNDDKIQNEGICSQSLYKYPPIILDYINEGKFYQKKVNFWLKDKNEELFYVYKVQTKGGEIIYFNQQNWILQENITQNQKSERDKLQMYSIIKVKDNR
eukprot:403332398